MIAPAPDRDGPAAFSLYALFCILLSRALYLYNSDGDN